MPIKLYNFALGPYPQRLNIYLAETNPTNVEFILFDEPHKQAGIPPVDASLRPGRCQSLKMTTAR